jgi:hypothetical protein
MPFGENTGLSQPAQHSRVYEARVTTGKQKPQTPGVKRKHGEASDSILPGPAYNAAGELVGGRTFRAKNQHEGLPTSLAEAYADGAKDKALGALRGTSFRSGGPAWDVPKKKAYDAGFDLAGAYAPLTNADAVRALTDRTVLVSPEGTDSGGRALKVAGFHPSTISASVSESTYAHQKIFDAQANILDLRAKGRLSSNEAADIAIAAVHLASLAPGEYAAQASFNPTKKARIGANGSLLPDKPESYEDRREELKITIANLALKLSVADRTVINKAVDDYLVSVAHGSLPGNTYARRLANVVTGDTKPAITSPLRTKPITPASPPELQLGHYESPPATVTALATPRTVADATIRFFDP